MVDRRTAFGSDSSVRMRAPKQTQAERSTSKSGVPVAVGKLYSSSMRRPSPDWQMKAGSKESEATDTAGEAEQQKMSQVCELVDHGTLQERWPEWINYCPHLTLKYPYPAMEEFNTCNPQARSQASTLVNLSSPQVSIIMTNCTQSIFFQGNNLVGFQAFAVGISFPLCWH
jgi:hypothetical protein